MAQSAFKRSIIWLHKWLGVVLALFFAMWFASGIVLYFVPFPQLTEAERLSGLAPLRVEADCCLSAARAVQQAGLQNVSAARLGMHGERPVWRVLGVSADDASAQPPARWHRVDARNGALLPALDAGQAAMVAQAFSGRAIRSVQALERDQWTVPQGLNPYRPLYKVSLADNDHHDDGLQLYVSATAGEVIRDTHRAERFWNWLGAVPHWIYPTVLREIPRLWHHVVVWLSIPAVFVALSGLVLGVWQLFLNRSRWIPYRVFWLRWHHILGLLTAVFTFTWMLSGLFSMNPFSLFSSQRPSATETQNWQAGQPPAHAPECGVAGCPAQSLLPVQQALALAGQAGLSVRELGLVSVGGQLWYWLRTPASGQQALLRADFPVDAPGGQTPVLHTRLPDALMMQTLTNMRPTLPVQLDVQQAYDGDYYAREPDTPQGRWRRPLPVWRAVWADGVRMYADPASGRIILRADRSTRWQRVLYNGLHSLDFAPLIRRPLLRDVLVVGLSVLGLLMCLTACVLAWRVTFPRKRHAGINAPESWKERVGRVPSELPGGRKIRLWCSLRQCGRRP